LINLHKEVVADEILLSDERISIRQTNKVDCTSHLFTAEAEYKEKVVDIESRQVNVLIERPTLAP
jgi:hypothetical protein